MSIANTSLDTDQNEKRTTYASAGVREYWIVDLKHRQVLILRDPQGGNYQFETVLSQGDIGLIAFPDIKVKIARLL